MVVELPKHPPPYATAGIRHKNFLKLKRTFTKSGSALAFLAFSA